MCGLCSEGRKGRRAVKSDSDCMRARATLLLLLTICLAATGCLDRPVQVRPLPVPPAEQPSANLPGGLHQRNWTGPLRQGSCVHASLVSHLRWQNQFELAERWRDLFRRRV